MLVTKQQSLAAIEDIEGQEQALTASDVHEVISRDRLNTSITANRVDRPLASGTPGTKPGFAGGREGSLQRLMELAPGKSFGIEPSWSRYLRACGMRYALCKQHAIASSGWTTGTVIPHGSTFVADSTFASGRVVGTRREGEDLFVVYEPRAQYTSTPIGAGDTQLTFSHHGATVAVVPLVSPGVIANAQAWYPDITALSRVILASVDSGPIQFGDELLGATSGARARCANLDGANGAFALLLDMHTGSPAFQVGETIDVVGGAASGVIGAGASAGQRQTSAPSLTIHTLTDGKRVKLTGARGTWSLLLQNMEQGIFTFDMRGVPLKPDDDVMFAFNNTLGAPPKITGSSFLIDGAFNPPWSQVQINGNTVVNMREDQGHSSLSGYRSAQITNYAHDLSIDPEAVQESIYPWWDKQFDKTSLRTKHVIGSGIGKTFEILQEHLEVDTLSDADRNERLTHSLKLMATSNDDLVGGGETIITLY